MFPEITYDEENGIAYIVFSDNEIVKSIESEDELFVLDVDKNGELVGIELLSVSRLEETFKNTFPKEKFLPFSPAMLPAYIIPRLFRCTQLGHK
jgi:uncharacterized protein YuzE